MRTHIKILKAHHGDCILIKTFDSDQKPYNILIDGGTAATFDYALKKELKKIDTIHLLILTHIDSDHIAGLIRFIKNSLFDRINIEKYWINGPNLLRISSGEEISYGQGKTLEELLIGKKELVDKWKDQVYIGAPLQLNNGIKFKILSPTKKIIDELYKKWPEVSKEFIKEYKDVDISAGVVESQMDKGALIKLATVPFKASNTIKADIVNSSSVALHLELFDTSILLLGDSRAEVIQASLENLGYTNENSIKADFVKISHHGSKNNTSNELLDLIDSQHYIISTNGGSSSHKLPDREVIARIIFHTKRDQNNPRTIYFNYSLDDIQEKSGKFIDQTDLLTGNWSYYDDVTDFPHVSEKINP